METPSSSIINKYLESEIALKFYIAIFPLVYRTFFNKKSKFFNFGTYDVSYERSSVINSYYVYRVFSKS